MKRNRRFVVSEFVKTCDELVKDVGCNGEEKCNSTHQEVSVTSSATGQNLTINSSTKKIENAWLDV